jgi:MinD superfamily P-loop ATPase
MAEGKKVYKIDKEVCISCGTCEDVCPVEGAVYMDEDGKYVIDPKKCEGCATCVDNCPVSCISELEEE